MNSQYTGEDVSSTLGVPPERVRVAYPGVGAGFTRDGPSESLGRPYVLTVATLEPRKNLETLLAAFATLRDNQALAVVGARGWGNVPALDQPHVLRLGYVPDATLAALYRGASVFVYPSRFEGFGMPIVEAMACGVPVVASAHPSLDEACGPAALRAAPEDCEAFAHQISRAQADRERLVEAGLAHARDFTWERTGRVFWQSLVQAAGR